MIVKGEYGSEVVQADADYTGAWTVTDFYCKYCGHRAISVHPSVCMELECSECGLFTEVEPIKGKTTN